MGSDGFLGALAVTVSTLGVLAAWSEQGTEPLVTVVGGAGMVLLHTQSTALFLVTLELQSYASYMIVALGNVPRYRLAGLSAYFLVGVGATASIMLGWGCIFRAGELSFLSESPYESGGMRILVAGLMIKVGCFPFSLWLPTAYGSMEYPALTAIGVLPQLPVFIQISAIAAFDLPLAYGVATGSVFVGSLLSSAAISLRQLLALSGTAHVGYVFSGTPFTLYPVLLYSLVYAGIFVLFCTATVNCGGRTVSRVSQLRGSLGVYLLPACALIACLMSLGGVPPLLGFYSKACVLLGGIALSNSLVPPVLLLFAGAVGLVAYLRIGLVVAGYPQSNGYLLQPPMVSAP